MISANIRLKLIIVLSCLQTVEKHNHCTLIQRLRSCQSRLTTGYPCFLWKYILEILARDFMSAVFPKKFTVLNIQRPVYHL